MPRQQTQKIAMTVITAVAFLVILPIIFVIGFLVYNGIGALSWEFLSQPPRNGMTEGGLLPAILGTIFLTLGTAVAAIPLGIGAAIYLAEYAGNNRLTRTIRLAIVNLAGIPSIVYGLFGLGAFVLFLNFGTSILAGSLTLGLMTLPVLISTAEEAIRSVPADFRTVSLSLGATRWQTIRHQVLPHALPGIITGMILAFAKAMLLETGVAATPGIDFDPGRGQRFLRFSYSGSTADMSEAARRLTAWPRLASRQP